MREFEKAEWLVVFLATVFFLLAIIDTANFFFRRLIFALILAILGAAVIVRIREHQIHKKVQEV